MSKRLTRKQIKEDIRHDDLQTAMATTVDGLRSHQTLLIWTLAVTFGAAIVLAIFVNWKRDRDRSASEALAKAIRIYSAPVQEEGAKPDDPFAPSFASDEERLEQARTALDEVSGGVADDLASLYRADIALREGDTEAARSAWEAFLEDHEGHALAYSVRRNLIHLDRQGKRGEEVVAELEAELDAAEKTLPEDVLLFELAETLDELGRGEEARTYYQRILDDFPDSAFAATAREKTSP